MVKTTVITQEKKLKELTQNVMLPFTPAETVLNLSTTKLSDVELEILKDGLKHSIELCFLVNTLKWRYPFFEKDC